tara:strand:+ start:723 stop:1361 length:639 start_codon:yes stop_codon:yes gene_type:complete
MEDYNVNVDHAKHSIGGDFGHVIRRITHVSMVIIPLLYYSYGNKISAFLSLNPQEFVSLVCLSIMLVEGMRLKMGIVVIGQREYESDQFSALAWGTLSVSIALLISPTMGNTGFKAGLFGTPIIFGLCIVDPVMGEVKRRTEGLGTAIVFGLLVSYVVWLGCWHFIGTPLLASVLLAPLTVAGELPKTKSIDDNATMVFFPLIGLILLQPWL